MSDPVVPYHAQWESRDLVSAILTGATPAAHDPLWRRSGARDPDEYEYWSWRSCGLACLRMLLEAHGRTAPPTVALAVESFAHGAFERTGSGMKGLIYRPFIAWVRDRFGLELDLFEHRDTAWLRRRVSEGALAIASVHPDIRDADGPDLPPSRGGHLVLVTAAEPEGLRLHNPSGSTRANQESHRVRDSRFTDFFSGRGMICPAPA